MLVTTHYLEETSQCDRLVIMAAGRVVAEGTEDAIVGDRTAVEVELASTGTGMTPAAQPGAKAGADWATVFGVLADAGLPVALHGRTLRVAGGDEARVRAALDARLVAASLRVVPATLEETFVELAQGNNPPNGDRDADPAPHDGPPSAHPKGPPHDRRRCAATPGAG